MHMCVSVHVCVCLGAPPYLGGSDSLSQCIIHCLVFMSHLGLENRMSLASKAGLQVVAIPTQHLHGFWKSKLRSSFLASTLSSKHLLRDESRFLFIVPKCRQFL